MKTENPNRAAFPASDASFGGLTKRELFAAMMLQGMLSNEDTSKSESRLLAEHFRAEAFYKSEAQIACSRADALLAELEKKT